MMNSVFLFFPLEKVVDDEKFLKYFPSLKKKEKLSALLQE